MDAKTQKSEQTRKAIIDAALEQALEKGLFSLTLQVVADKLQLSKSGIFSRVGSKESLQHAVIQEYGLRFVEDVFKPALSAPRGVERLSKIFDLWIDRVVSAQSMGSSLYEATAFSIELDTQIELKQQLIDGVSAWRAILRRCLVHCIELQQFKEDTDVDAFLLDIHNLVLGLLYEKHFMKQDQSKMRTRKGFRLLLERHLSEQYRYLSG